MPPNLEHRFALRAYLSKDNICDLQAIRSGPRKYIAAITGGFLKGEGLDAELLPGGADWMSLDPTTGVSQLDVRAQARTSDGHYISVQYTGVLKHDEAVVKVLNWAEDAKTTEFGQHEWFAAPRFETSDPALKWIEDAFWVGRGRAIVDEKGSAVEYEICLAVN